MSYIEQLHTTPARCLWPSTAACCGQGRSRGFCSVCVSFCYPDKFDEVHAPAADEVGESTPRLLINRERVGEGHPLLRLLGYQTGGFCFDEGSNYRCELRVPSCPWLSSCSMG